MKKLFVVFFTALFSLGLIAHNAMAAEPTGEEMVTDVFTGSEEVPPAPLTAEEIAKAVRKEMGDIPRALHGVKGKITKKDTETAGAINEVGTKIDKLSGKIGAFDNVSRMTSRVGVAVNRNTFYLAIVMVAGFLIIALLTLLNGRSMHNLGSTVDRVEKKVGEVPQLTADKVRELNPITIDFMVKGRKYHYTPPIVNGSYLSLYVPKQAEDLGDPSKIIRLPIDQRGKLYKSTLEVITSYLNGEYAGSDVHSRLQKEVVHHANKMGELKIYKTETA